MGEEKQTDTAARHNLNTVNRSGWFPARILWPALGCPEVIDPVGFGPMQNPTNQVHLLLLSGRQRLSKEDVARNLRYVPWKDRRCRYAEAKVGTNAFAAVDLVIIDVLQNVGPKDKDHMAVQVRFAGGYVFANLAQKVVQFYAEQRMSYLHAVSVSEEGSAALARDTLYHLFWVSEDKNATPNDISDDMSLLIEKHAIPRGGRDAREGFWQMPLKDRRSPFHYMLQEYEFDYGQPQQPQNRTEVLHPLFVRNGHDILRLAHITDIHTDTRHYVYSRHLAGSQAGKELNNWNQSFSDLYLQAQSSDAILLTGDLIEYGRGHLEKMFSLGQNNGYWRDRNWFLFYKLLASGDDRYKTPVYTSLGNHDWRVNPYGPEAPGATSPHELNMAKDEYLKTAWGEDYGPIAATLFGSNLEGQALETTVESLAWYLLVINPFLDYTVQYPGGKDPVLPMWHRFSFLMLDWGGKEEAKPWKWPWHGVADDEGDYVVIKSRGLPWAAAALTALQKNEVEWFVTQECAKVVGLHFQVIGPRPSWPQEAMYEGLIDPCPICKGRGTLNVYDGGQGYHDEDCACRKAVTQPSNYRTKHPIRALGNPGGLEGNDLLNVQARWGSFVHEREWLIQTLMNKEVSLVLSGHAHRNSAFIIRRPYIDDTRKLPAGTAFAVSDDRLKTFNLKGLAEAKEQRPLFVNTVCGGPDATDRVSGGTIFPEAPHSVNKGRKTGVKRVPPGFRIIQLRQDGAILSVENFFSQSPALVHIENIEVVQ